MVSIAVLLSLISYALARPSGSPICQKNNEFTMIHGAKADKSAPFRATVVAGKDLTAKITITGNFAGMLLYVNKANGNRNVGSFATQNKFDYVSGCDSENKSTLTHKDSSVKTGAAFDWTAPEAGSYVVNAIIAGSAVQWNEFSINIDLGAEEKSMEATAMEKQTAPQVKGATAPSYETNPSSSGRKLRKCREKEANLYY